MSSGWFYLAAMVVAYGISNLLQSYAATRTKGGDTLEVSLLLRLAGQGVYLLGLGFQILGFVLAFVARRDLPLFLVQASMTAGLGVTAVLGVIFLKWRLPRAELLLLTVLGGCLAALILSASPAPSRGIGLLGVVLLAAAFLGIAVAGIYAARLTGVRASVVMGFLAGLNFGAAALASRPLANVRQPQEFLTDPLLYLLIVHSLCGSLLLAVGMQRGSTMAAIAGMDVGAAAPAAVLGLLFLGDQIVAGREWLAALGFLGTLATVLAITRYAAPQAPREDSREKVGCLGVTPPG